MALTTTDLAAVRDEIGTATPPTDSELHLIYDELGSSIQVSLRVLRRRRAALAGGEVTGVTLPGVVSVSLRGSLSSLDSQIRRLEILAAAENTTPTAPVGGRLVRNDIAR